MNGPKDNLNWIKYNNLFDKIILKLNQHNLGKRSRYQEIFLSQKTSQL